MRRRRSVLGADVPTIGLRIRRAGLRRVSRVAQSLMAPLIAIGIEAAASARAGNEASKAEIVGSRVEAPGEPARWARQIGRVLDAADVASGAWWPRAAFSRMLKSAFIGGTQ